jgi:hypothetical protein
VPHPRDQRDRVLVHRVPRPGHRCPAPDGRVVDDELLAHIWPTHHEHFYGTHSVDIDGELARLDADGHRPLRMAPAADTGPGGPVALP